MAVKLSGGVVKPSMWGDILHTLFQFILVIALLKLEIISKWKLKLSKFLQAPSGSWYRYWNHQTPKKINCLLILRKN